MCIRVDVPPLCVCVSTVVFCATVRSYLQIYFLAAATPHSLSGGDLLLLPRSNI